MADLSNDNLSHVAKLLARAEQPGLDLTTRGMTTAKLLFWR